MSMDDDAPSDNDLQHQAATNGGNGTVKSAEPDTDLKTIVAGAVEELDLSLAKSERALAEANAILRPDSKS
jgi:hypothetical protein